MTATERDLAQALLAIYEAASGSDAGLYNVVKQCEHDPRCDRTTLKTVLAERREP